MSTVPNFRVPVCLPACLSYPDVTVPDEWLCLATHRDAVVPAAASQHVLQNGLDSGGAALDVDALSEAHHVNGEATQHT